MERKLLHSLLIFIMLFTTCSLKASNLVDIKSIDDTIALEMKYATADNFLHKKVYDFADGKLLKDVAAELSKAQQEFKKHNVGLKVWDAYRPLYVQKIMWEIMPDERYVADPAKGGRHTRGTAVDVTLIDLKTGKDIAMPTKFDEFIEQAHRSYRHPDAQIRANAALLESIMSKHGFIGLPTEWWHFDYQNWQNQPVITD